MQLTYNEIMDVLDTKYFPSARTGYTLPLGKYEMSDINKTLQYLLPDNVKANIAIDDVRLETSLIINRTLIFTEKSFFYKILGFTQSNSGLLGDVDGYIQIIPGKYKSIKCNNITPIDKVPLKCDCIQGSIVNGIREPILYSFALDKRPTQKTYKEPRIKLF